MGPTDGNALADLGLISVICPIWNEIRPRSAGGGEVRPTAVVVGSVPHVAGWAARYPVIESPSPAGSGRFPTGDGLSITGYRPPARAGRRPPHRCLAVEASTRCRGLWPTVGSRGVDRGGAQREPRATRRRRAQRAAGSRSGDAQRASRRPHVDGEHSRGPAAAAPSARAPGHDIDGEHAGPPGPAAAALRARAAGRAAAASTAGTSRPQRRRPERAAGHAATASTQERARRGPQRGLQSEHAAPHVDARAQQRARSGG